MIWVVALFALLSACGEDRTHEYEEKTVRDRTMLETMQAEYLWGDSIKEEKIGWKDYFAKPQDFFGRLTAMAPVHDSWSYCSIDTLEENHGVRGMFDATDSYGLDFSLMTDPTGGTSRQYARITTVYAGSAAEACGLHRGDFISTLNGNRITTSVAAGLRHGRECTLVRLTLGADTTETGLAWQTEDTLTMAASGRVADVAVPVWRVLGAADGRRVVYAQCNRLDDTAVTALTDKLRGAVASGSDRNVLVLDMRLCNTGTMPAAVRLASMLIDEGNASQPFATLIYRSDHTPQRETVGFDAQAVAANLPFERVYIIESAYTSGAAEWLTRALQYAEDTGTILTAGTASAGQIVELAEIATPYFYTLHPAVCYVADGGGSADYAQGIAPDIAVDEMAYVELRPYGDSAETVLAAVLEHIATRP